MLVALLTKKLASALAAAASTSTLASRSIPLSPSMAASLSTPPLTHINDEEGRQVPSYRCQLQSPSLIGNSQTCPCGSTRQVTTPFPPWIDEVWHAAGSEEPRHFVSG